MTLEGTLYKISASFSLFGDNIDIDEISSLSKIPPSSAWRKNDRYVDVKGIDRVRKNGLWSVNISVDSPDINRATERLSERLSMIDPKVTKLPHVTSSEIDIFIAFQTTKVTVEPSLQIDADILNNMSRMSSRLTITVSVGFERSG